MDQYILKISADILLLDAMDLVKIIEENGGEHLQVYAKVFTSQIIDEISGDITDGDIKWGKEQLKSPY